MLTQQIKSGEGRINKKPMKISEILPMLDGTVGGEESFEMQANMLGTDLPINHAVVENELGNIAHSLFGLRNFSMEPTTVETKGIESTECESEQEIRSTSRLDVHLAHMYPDRFMHRLRRPR